MPAVNVKELLSTFAKPKPSPIEVADAAARVYGHRSKMFKSWWSYHRLNPHVYGILVTVLREGKRLKGYDTWSIQGAMEVVRWDERFQIVGFKEFKIANEYGAYYARLIQMQEDDLFGFLITTKANADHELGWLAFLQAKK